MSVGAVGVDAGLLSLVPDAEPTSKVVNVVSVIVPNEWTFCASQREPFAVPIHVA